MTYCKQPLGIHFYGWMRLRSRWPHQYDWSPRFDIFDIHTVSFCSTPRRSRKVLTSPQLLQKLQVPHPTHLVSACWHWYLETEGMIHIIFLWFRHFDHPKWVGRYFKAILLGSSIGRSMMGLASSMRRMSRTSSTYGYKKNSSSYSFIFYLL